MELFTVIVTLAIITIIAKAIMHDRQNQKEELIENKQTAFNQSVQSEYEKLTAGEIVCDTISDIPVKPMEGEKFFFCKIAVMGQMKRDGNFGYGALTTNIRVAPGVYIRLGSGRLAIDESWVYDQAGILCLSNKRLFFANESRNTTVNFSRIADWAYFPHDGILHIGKQTGKNMRYDIEDKMTPREVALLSLSLDADVMFNDG